jgi:hypothetical protein
MVITSEESGNVEELLDPYNENESVERYVAHTKEELIQKEKEDLEYFRSTYYTEYLKDPSAYVQEHSSNPHHITYITEEFPDHLTWDDEKLYQDAIKRYDPDNIGPNGEVYSTYNPRSKWDWYEVGGRWTGIIKTKDGESVDDALIDELDWDHEDMKNFATFAVITPDGAWHERGQMGWFGCSSETREEGEVWDSKFKERFIDPYIDPYGVSQYYVTIVDCHI